MYSLILLNVGFVNRKAGCKPLRYYSVKEFLQAVSLAFTVLKFYSRETCIYSYGLINEQSFQSYVITYRG